MRSKQGHWSTRVALHARGNLNMVKHSKTLKFGRCLFKVTSTKSELIDLVESVFANVGPENSSSGLHGLVYEEDLDSYAAEQSNNGAIPTEESIISRLVRRISSEHEGCLWIDAATLRAPSGELVLIAGPSFSGKTTLALAMSLSQTWKLLAEDITIIDPFFGQVIPSPSPSGIREGTSELLAKTCGISVQGLQLNERGNWLLDSSLYCLDSSPAKFTVAIVLNTIDRSSSAEMEVRSLTPAEFVRRILPISNLIRELNGTDILYDSVRDARCLTVKSGSLGQRVNLLLAALKG